MKEKLQQGETVQSLLAVFPDKKKKQIHAKVSKLKKTDKNLKLPHAKLRPSLRKGNKES